MRSVKIFVASFIGTFGALWTIIESLGFFFDQSVGPKVKTWNEGLGFWILLAVSILVAWVINSMARKDSDLDPKDKQPKLKIRGIGIDPKTSLKMGTLPII